MKIRVIVRFQFEAVHRWQDAPREIAESYLSFPHRHMFHVEAVKPVNHVDREIEFIGFRREMFEHCGKEYGFGVQSASCEKIAVDLLERFNLEKCRVFEDNENGAEVEK